MSRKNSSVAKSLSAGSSSSASAVAPAIGDSAGTTPANLYRQIIQDVIKNMRSEFSYAGVDENVLLKLQEIWEQKLREENTAPGFTGTLPAAPRPAPAAVAPPPAPAPNPAFVNLSQTFDFSFADPAAGEPLQMSIFGGTSLVQSASWLTGLTDAAGSVPLASPAPAVLAAGAALMASRSGGVKHEADVAAAQPPSKRQVSNNKLPLAIPSGSQLDGATDEQDDGGPAADSTASPARASADERQRLDLDLLRRLATAQAFRSTSQLDGFDDDDDEEDGVPEPKSNAAAGLVSALADDLEKDPDDINDPDLDDESDPQAEETRNLVLCQFEKVTVKGKRKHGCSLKDGIMQLNGVDVLFSKATGEFSFHKPAPGK